MKENLVSIIVPIYNVANYLCATFDSVAGQTYSDIETILIDDGSSDQSASMSDEFAINNPDIIILHKLNGGLSDARNVGIGIATGNYCFFLDSDDVIAQNAIEVLLQQAIKTESEIVVCNVDDMDENGIRLTFSSYPRLKEEIYTEREALSELASANEHTWTVAWDKIYKKNLLSDFSFPFGKIHEDVFTAHILLGKAKKVAVVSEPLYFHRTRSGSIMTTRGTYSYQCSIEALMDRIDYMINHELNEAAHNVYFQCFEMIKIAYWSGNYCDERIQGVVKQFIEKYEKRFSFQGIKKLRLALFWMCPALERIVSYLLRKAN